MKIYVLPRLLLSSFIFSLFSGFAVSSGGEEIVPPEVIPRPQVKVGGYHFEDSGKFNHSYGNIQGKFHFTPGKFVEATSTRNWILQEEDQVSGNGLQLLFGDTFGKKMEGRIGFGVDDYENYDAKLSYLTSLALPVLKTGYLTLKYEYGNVVTKVSRIDALKEDISSHEFSPTYYHWISQRWSYWGQINMGSYSDGNLRSTLNSSLSYMLKIDPSVSLTYALYYNAFKDKSEFYWDPRGYLGHILILRMKEDIGNLLTVNLGGSLGFSPTEKKRTNPGFSLRLSLPDSPRWGLDVSGEYKGGGRREEFYSFTTTSINLFYLP
jgi:hypothetical protein